MPVPRPHIKAWAARAHVADGVEQSHSLLRPGDLGSASLSVAGARAFLQRETAA